MKKILVTGGAGFIGYTISKILAEDPNNEVHIIDNFFKERNDDDFKRLTEKNNVTFFNNDLTDQKTYTEIDGYEMPRPRAACRYIDPASPKQLIELLQNEAKVI